MNPLLDSAREILSQGADLLLALEDEAYAAKVPAAFNASIGGHMRHSLDHFRALLDGFKAGEIDYDARGRDPDIENNRLIALAAARAQLKELKTLDTAVLERSVRVRSKISYGDVVSPTASSSVGREVMFCVAHAIHHYALIGVICGLLGVALPAGFGVAPSTLKHHRDRLAA